MGTYGYMILAKDPDQISFEPIKPFRDMGYDAWCYSKDAADRILDKLTRRELEKPQDKRTEFILTTVKG